MRVLRLFGQMHADDRQRRLIGESLYQSLVFTAKRRIAQIDAEYSQHSIVLNQWNMIAGGRCVSIRACSRRQTVSKRPRRGGM